MVELHKAEQRWVPAKEMLKDMSEEKKVTAELYRKFQGILNKLTPQKFQSLAEQALDLKINTEERLKGTIDKIFTKVHCTCTVYVSNTLYIHDCTCLQLHTCTCTVCTVYTRKHVCMYKYRYTHCTHMYTCTCIHHNMYACTVYMYACTLYTCVYVYSSILQALEEPNFSIAYANLCKVLSPIKVEWTVDGKAKFTTFRRVLLTKCQQEFEKDKKDDEDREERLVAIEKAETVREKREGGRGRREGGEREGGREGGEREGERKREGEREGGKEREKEGERGDEGRKEERGREGGREREREGGEGTCNS